MNEELTRAPLKKVKQSPLRNERKAAAVCRSSMSSLAGSSKVTIEQAARKNEEKRAGKQARETRDSLWISISPFKDSKLWLSSSPRFSIR